MPIYDFKCLNCDHEFEALVKTDKSKPGCPKCGSDSYRLLSAPGGFVKKGEGFYKRN